MDLLPGLVGLDDHDETIHVCACAMDDTGEVLCNRNAVNDAGALRDVVQRLLGQVRRLVRSDGDIRHVEQRLTEATQGDPCCARKNHRTW